MNRPFHDLSTFVQYLEREGELRRVSTEVDPVLEVTEIVTRVAREGGPAVLFEHPKGSEFPLLINIFGTDRRVETVLGKPPQAIGEELAALLEKLNPPTPRKLLSLLPYAKKLQSMKTPVWGRGPVQQIVEEPDLTALPALKCWPKDGGRFITFPLVITHSVRRGTRNLGTYRMQIFNAKETGMHWQIHKGGAKHYYEAEAAGKDLEVAVVIGGDPVLAFAAVAPLPDEVDEIGFAGYLRGLPIPVAPAKTISYLVPAEAEFVLEGLVPKGERRLEGPFGDHFGHYSEAAMFPVFHVRAVTRRRNPIYHGIFVGKPPQEDGPIGNAISRMFDPLLKIIFPEIKDLWAYEAAGFHNLLVVAVEERYPRHAVKTMMSVWGFGQLSLTKTIITVSKDVNPRDFQAVLAEIGRHFNPAEDFLLIHDAILDDLDFTGREMRVGSKMGLNACAKDRPPHAAPALSDEVVSDLPRTLPGVRKAKALPGGFLVLQVEGEGKPALRRFLALPHFADVKMVVAVSADVRIEDPTELIWGIFTRFDPQRDVFFEHTELDGARAVYGGRMCVDATWKPGYPEPIVMDEAVVKEVDRKWDLYWKKT